MTEAEQLNMLVTVGLHFITFGLGVLAGKLRWPTPNFLPS